MLFFLSENRAFPAFGADKPVSPYGHALNLAIGLSRTLYHPLNIILIVDAEIAELALAHGWQTVVQPVIDPRGGHALFCGKFLGRIVPEIGLDRRSLRKARHDAI